MSVFIITLDTFLIRHCFSELNIAMLKYFSQGSHLTKKFLDAWFSDQNIFAKNREEQSFDFFTVRVLTILWRRKDVFQPSSFISYDWLEIILSY